MRLWYIGTNKEEYCNFFMGSGFISMHCKTTKERIMILALYNKKTMLSEGTVKAGLSKQQLHFNKISDVSCWWIFSSSCR